MNTPNKLTLFRIFLIPIIVFIYLFPSIFTSINIPIYYLCNSSITLLNIIVVVLFAIASITDFIDGNLARKYHLITTFGKFMDPIADKLLVNTLLILLTASGRIHVLVCIIMIARDTIVDAIRLLASQNNVVLAASPLGKAKTFTQMFAIVFLLLNNIPFSAVALPVDMILIYSATIISFISGFDYVYKNINFIMESK